MILNRTVAPSCAQTELIVIMSVTAIFNACRKNRWRKWLIPSLYPCYRPEPSGKEVRLKMPTKGDQVPLACKSGTPPQLWETLKGFDLASCASHLPGAKAVTARLSLGPAWKPVNEIPSLRKTNVPTTSLGAGSSPHSLCTTAMCSPANRFAPA